MLKSKALVRSKKWPALTHSAQTEIFSAARDRAQFFGSLALSLALSNKRVPLNFALICKRFVEVFCIELQGGAKVVRQCVQLIVQLLVEIQNSFCENIPKS